MLPMWIYFILIFAIVIDFVPVSLEEIMFHIFSVNIEDYVKTGFSLIPIQLQQCR